MLQRILHFTELPPAPASNGGGGVGAEVPRWRSGWPLSGAEAAFVEAVLEHRKRSLRNAAHDDHEPIPLGAWHGVAGPLRGCCSECGKPAGRRQSAPLIALLPRRPLQPQA